MYVNNVLIIISTAVLLGNIICDIPTHCLSHQIIGDWVFYQTEPTTKSLAELYKHKCGIKDFTNKNEINKFNMDVDLFKNSIKINFDKNHKAEITQVDYVFKGSKVK